MRGERRCHTHTLHTLHTMDAVRRDASSLFAIVVVAECNVQYADKADGETEDEKPTNCMHACDVRVKYVLRCPCGSQCTTDSNAAQRQPTQRSKGHPSFDRHKADETFVRQCTCFFFFHFHFCVCQTEFARRPQFLVPPIALHFIGEKVRSQCCASSLVCRTVAHHHLPIIVVVFSLVYSRFRSVCVCFFAVALLLAMQRSSRQKRHGTVRRFHLGGLDFARRTINNKYCFLSSSFPFVFYVCVRTL